MYHKLWQYFTFWPSYGSTSWNGGSNADLIKRSVVNEWGEEIFSECYIYACEAEVETLFCFQYKW